MSKLVVKIPVATAIASLQARLARHTAAEKVVAAVTAKHKKAEAAYMKKRLDVVKKMVNRMQNVSSIDFDAWGHEEDREYLRVSFNRVELSGEERALLTGKNSPTIDVSYPEDFNGNDLLSDSEVREIEQAIRILKMTDDTHVNTTTLRSISQYF
jgi:hypothetical protein